MASTDISHPGLFHIGFNIEKSLSNQYLAIKNKRLTYCLGVEPIYIKPVIQNLLALLSFNRVSGRIEARLMLEQLIMDYPNDLNILADLIYVYKKSGRDRDSGILEKRLDSIKDDPLLKAQSILGQAYALNNFAEEHNRITMFFQKDTWKQLNMENGQVKQRRKVKNLTVEAYKVAETIPGTLYDKQIQESEIVVDKFKEGIKMLKTSNCSPDEILVWEHNFASAVITLETFRYVRGGDHCNWSENHINALETHLNVIENLSQKDERLKRYIALSNVKFAAFHLSLADLTEYANLPEKIKNLDLDSMFYQAMFLLPNDPHILGLCGGYQCSKMEYLKAIKLYDKSISLLPDIDINLAYLGRSQALYGYSMKLAKNKSAEAQLDKHLELAYNDMKLCLQCTHTETIVIGLCMTFMAYICFQRAKPGDEKLGMSFCCQDIGYIYRALETLNEAMDKLGKNKEYRIYLILGKCYPYIGEYKKAIGSLKTALDLSGWSMEIVWAFTRFCAYSIFYYERENDKTLLSDFCFMLKEAKKRHYDKGVTDAIDIMCRHHAEMLTNLIQNMIESDVTGCKLLIDEALNMSLEQMLTECVDNCMKKVLTDFLENMMKPSCKKISEEVMNDTVFKKLKRQFEMRQEFETKLECRNSQEVDIHEHTMILDEVLSKGVPRMMRSMRGNGPNNDDRASRIQIVRGG